jgi:hypothetical protein
MIWIFFLIFGVGMALTFASLDCIPAAQAHHRNTVVRCGFVIFAIFALGFTVDLNAILMAP